jgi:hypothetical protein
VEQRGTDAHFFEGISVTKTLRLVWDARDIGRVINRSPRQTYHLLARGLIRAARKVGERHCADESALEKQFGSDSKSDPTDRSDKA